MRRGTDQLKLLVFNFVSSFLVRELKDARERWRRGLKGEQPWLPIPVTAISMYALWQWAFEQGLMFGLSFLFAALLAIGRGHIFTHPFRLILVAVAVVIGTLVIPGLRGDAWQTLREGDVLGALVIVGVVIFFWRLKKQMETGQMENDGIEGPKRRRKSRRRKKLKHPQVAGGRRKFDAP